MIQAKEMLLGYIKLHNIEKNTICDNITNCIKLCTVCEFKNGKQLSKAKINIENYPVISGGKKPIGYHNDYNRNENTILCSQSGSAGYISKYSEKIWANDCFSINSKNTDILDEKYLYYYLKHIQDDIYKLKSEVAQGHVYSKDIENLMILMPSLTQQKNIVKQLDY